MHRLLRAIPLPLTALVALGCTPSLAPEAPTPTPATSASPSPSPVPASTPPPAVRLAWQNRVALVGAPAVTDDVIVAYVHVGSSLALVGYETLTGNELWRRAAVPGGGTIGVAINPQILQHDGGLWAAALAATGSGLHRVMVLDARTGDEVRLPALEFWGLTRPRRCSDDDPAFCFQIHRSDDAGGTRYRADPVAGTLAPDPSYVPAGNVRFLGEHVYSTNDRADEGGTELLGYQADGRTLWEVPYVDVFGPRSSSDSGWSWDDEGAGERIIGIGGAGYYAGIKAGDEIPADALRAVGLDRSTGRVAWSIKGASHCPMDVEARPRVSDHFIACSFTGKEVIVDAGADGLRTDFSGLVGELVAIDRASGTIAWRQSISTGYFDFDWAFVSDDSEAVLRGVGDTAVLVDLGTGDAAPAGADEVFACERERAWVPLRMGDEEHEFAAGEGRFPCDRSGVEVDAWTPGSLRRAGQEGGGLVIVAGADTISGYLVAH